MKKMLALALLLCLGLAVSVQAADRVITKKDGSPIKISWIG